MIKAAFCFLIFLVFVSGMAVGFIGGFEEANFDRQAANNKLQNCLAVVRQ